MTEIFCSPNEYNYITKFANMKLPESFNFGNAACNNSQNSSPEQSTFSTTIFFSPSPASNKASFSVSLVGMISWAQRLKQTNLCVHVLAACLHGHLSSRFTELFFCPKKDDVQVNSLLKELSFLDSQTLAVRPSLALRRLLSAKSHIC